jgi:hypothetical protein
MATEKFICTSVEKDAFDCTGKKIGVTGKRVLCYSREIGRQRVYRREFVDIPKNMKRLDFKKIEDAQKMCDGINKAYNDDFVVEPA